jgi:hypothetical protein
LNKRREQALAAFRSKSLLAGGLVWCFYDGEPPNAEYREPRLAAEVELVEFDGATFAGSEVVRPRLAARGQWARQAQGGPSSWHIEPVGKFHFLASRALEGRWPPERERQPACILVGIRDGQISRIREFPSHETAKEALRDVYP